MTIFVTSTTVLLVLLTVLLVLLTVLPLSRSPVWWIRDLDFPRLQVCCIGLLVVLGHGVQYAYFRVEQPVFFITGAASLFCLIYQASWVLPYTTLTRCEVKSSKTGAQISLKLLTANVLMTNRDVATFCELVSQHQPDVVLTLESDQWWQEKLETNLSAYSYRVSQPQDNLYGMHLYSKLEIETSSIEFLVEDDIPSIFLSLRERLGRRIKLICLHPAPPSPTENSSSAERDAELILAGRLAAKEADPVIVTGDLNDVAWSETTRLFRKISGLLDARVGRGMFNTFHAEYWWMRWPLDHLFCSHEFELIKMERLPYFGSDHYALLTHLSLNPEKPEPQRGLDRDSKDVARAQEKLKAV